MDIVKKILKFNKIKRLGKIFYKGLSKDDKKEGILKKLKTIEDKNEHCLK